MLGTTRPAVRPVHDESAGYFVHLSRFKSREASLYVELT